MGWGIHSHPSAPVPHLPTSQITLNQARSQGIHAAHAMAGVEEDTASSMAFELFTHVTSFAGLKVVLLGRYNGQGLENEPEADLISYSRTTPPDPSQARRGGAGRFWAMTGREHCAHGLHPLR